MREQTNDQQFKYDFLKNMKHNKVLLIVCITKVMYSDCFSALTANDLIIYQKETKANEWCN